LFIENARKVREMEKWISHVSDVRDDETIGGQILNFLQQSAVRSVAMHPATGISRRTG
jgi:hypothetical protein